MHPYLYIGTYPILHQYLADFSIPSQSCPVQRSVTIHVHQVHTCRTFIHHIYISVEAFNRHTACVVIGTLPHQLHPPLMSVRMTSLCPISQARNSGVCFITSRESTIASLSSSSFTVLTWPDREAAWSAVRTPTHTNK